MNFRDKRRGGFTGAEKGYVKSVIARKIRVAAEQEIQQVLSELEQRIRQRIKSDVHIEVGEMHLVHKVESLSEEIAIFIHVVDKPNTKNGVTVDVSSLGYGTEFVKREPS